MSDKNDKQCAFTVHIDPLDTLRRLREEESIVGIGNLAGLVSAASDEAIREAARVAIQDIEIDLFACPSCTDDATCEEHSTPECESCARWPDRRGGKPTSFGPDPFASEIHGDYTPHWLWDACREESAHDI